MDIRMEENSRLRARPQIYSYFILTLNNPTNQPPRLNQIIASVLMFFDKKKQVDIWNEL